MENVLYITETEAGFEMEDTNGASHGVAETLAEAIQCGKDSVEIGLVTAWIINE